MGFAPRSDNDKWFVFTEDNRVFFHRSQTGDPVYQVILEPAYHGRKRIAQAWVAANKKNLQNANFLSRLFDELFYDDPLGSPISVRGEALQPAQRIWIYEGDLTTLTVDAIVNSADPSLLGGTGLDGDIHKLAGAGLLAECRAMGKCSVGEAKMTKGHSLPVKHVIHTVGPTWRGGLLGERRKLAACYANSLAMAANANLRTVVFPSISTGTKGFPLDEAAFIAAKTTLEFFARKPAVELVIFCTFTPQHTEAAKTGLARAVNR
jgi:O-acetyl-ADP-ribose deacetylase